MTGLRRFMKKSMRLLLLVVITASMMPVSAFADEVEGPIIITPENQEEKGVIEGNVNGTVVVTTDPEGEDAGNVSATVIGSIDSREYASGLAVSASNGHTATVTTKDVTYSGEEGGGITVITTNDGEADVTAGNVSGTTAGVAVMNTDLDEEGDPIGNGGTAKVKVSGNVSGSEMGVADITGGGNTEITIGGDISGDGMGLSSMVGEGKSSITVDGNVTGNQIGLMAVSSFEAGSVIRVRKNVISERIGIFAATGTDVFPQDSDDKPIGTVDIYVDGTVDGEGIGIGLREGEKSNITVTAWKIIPHEIDGSECVAANIGRNFGVGQPDRDFEKNNINYIIKVEQPAEGATLTASQGTAHEGESVTLKIDLQEGYYVTGAFSNEGKSIPLLKDASGNYYVVVPKGGGVYLSVTLYKIPSEPEADKKDDQSGPFIPADKNTVSDGSQNNTDENTPAAYGIIDIEAMMNELLAGNPELDVLDLYFGKHVNLTLKEIRALLEQHTDKTKRCHFDYEGKKWIMMVPPMTLDQNYQNRLAIFMAEPNSEAGFKRISQIFGFGLIEE